MPRVNANALSPNCPTKPENVTANTPLADLYLDWTEKELPERIRTKHVHRLHPYLGKYVPQLVEIFLRKFFIPGQIILDPFAGSGTTLIQANELGIDSIGYDVSAFNVLLTKVKAAHYDLSKVEKEIKEILFRVEQFAVSNDDLLFRLTQSTSETPNDYLTKWFSPNALSQLLYFKSIIKDYEHQDLLKVILSRSARSARLTTHFDLDFPKKPQHEPYHCFKHKRICHPINSANKFLRRYSLDTVKRIKEYALTQTNAKIEIFHEDSSKAKIPHIDGVITSPPYVGLINYHEQHQYAYEFLGLEDRRSEEIGQATLGTSKKAKKDYQDKIISVFANTCKSMTKGGHFVVIASDKHELYDDIAKALDVDVIDVVKRHVNRRTGRRSTEFYESVFIWRKR